MSKRRSGNWVIETDDVPAPTQSFEVTDVAASIVKKKRKGKKTETPHVDEWTDLPVAARKLPAKKNKNLQAQIQASMASTKNVPGWRKVEVDESKLYGDIGGFYGLEELDGDYDFASGEFGAREVVAKGTKTMEEEVPTLVPVEGEEQKKNKNKNKNKNKKDKKEIERVVVEKEKEEIEGVVDETGKEVEKGEDKIEANVKPIKRDRETSEDTEPTKKKNKKQKTEKAKKEVIQPVVIEEPDMDKIDMTAWNTYELHPQVLKGLASLKFFQPTPIQRAVLAPAMEGKDIMGAAETGSGKTLAFGLPMVQGIVEAKSNPDLAQVMSARPLLGLVLCPTRELAIQVKDHIAAAARYTDVRVIALVGGISLQKQIRLLTAKPEIVVATPGRFYELTKQHDHLKDLSRVKFLVLDEADRMVEKNHYEELFSILAMLPARKGVNVNGNARNMQRGRRPNKQQMNPEEEAQNEIEEVVAGEEGEEGDDVEMEEDVEEGEDEKEEGEEKEIEEEGEEVDDVEMGEDVEDVEDVEEVEEGEDEDEEVVIETENERRKNAVQAWEQITNRDVPYERQVFVFSATLTLQVNKMVHKKPKKGDLDQSLDTLKKTLAFREEAAIIDLSSQTGMAEALTEGCISCLKEEKDLYLYYLLMHYPGRTVIFVNSIDCIRHITPLLTLLGLDPLPLHAKMQQRQRLKNLDRFKARPRGVLIATDVAARGLDIQGIEHVVHYQLPRTSELYVHRSGRTARAKKDGISLLLLGPEDMPKYRKICHTLKKEEGLNSFPIDMSYFPNIKKRVTMARKIDAMEHSQRKGKSSNDWFLKAAEEMDIEVDEGLLVPEAESRKEKEQNAELRQMRDRLLAMLKEPLMPQGMSTRYITSTPIPDLSLRLTHSKAGAGMPLLPHEQTLDSAVQAINPAKKIATNLGKNKKRRVERKAEKKKN